METSLEFGRQMLSVAMLSGNSTHHKMDKDVPCCGPEFWMLILLCVGLVVFAALMAGLTMGLMSFDAMNIAIIEASGTDSERIYARAIAPVIKRRHLLLVTLLIGNATAMEALPIFLDRLVPNYLAIILSVTFVLAFGEILPQAVFTAYRLPIGAYLSGFVATLMFLLFPIAYPISKLLDWMLGSDHPTIYRRAELKELTTQHLMDEAGNGTLSKDEVKIMIGTLDMAEKKVWHAMQGMDKSYMLSLDVELDLPVMEQIMESGHSRVPVFHLDRSNVVGVLIVKNLILVDPGTKPTLRQVSKFAIRKISRVSSELPLFELLHFFRKGRCHLALVCGPEDLKTRGESAEAIGLISMEDVMEELIQEEILDETDEGVDAVTALARKFMLKESDKGSIELHKRHRRVSHSTLVQSHQARTRMQSPGRAASARPRSADDTTTALLEGGHARESLSTMERRVPN